MPDQPFTPPQVGRIADMLHAATGCAPDADQVRPGRWRVAAASDRVRVTVTVTVRTRGRVGGWRSTLEIDGRQVPRVADLDQLAAVFADPDGHDAAADDDGLPPVQAADPADAPEHIREAHQQFMAGLETVPGVAPIIGRVRGQWVIAIETDRVVLRLTQTHGISSRTAAERRYLDDVLLIVDGEDLSARAAGQLDEALRLAGPALSGATAPPATGPVKRSAAAPAVTNAVRVRRTTVIRV